MSDGFYQDPTVDEIRQDRDRARAGRVMNGDEETLAEVVFAGGETIADWEASQIARAVLASGWLAAHTAAAVTEARAEAWDEGRANGLRSRLTDSGEQRSNPYRAAVESAQEKPETPREREGR